MSLESQSACCRACSTKPQQVQLLGSHSEAASSRQGLQTASSLPCLLQPVARAPKPLQPALPASDIFQAPPDRFKPALPASFSCQGPKPLQACLACFSASMALLARSPPAYIELAIVSPARTASTLIGEETR